MPDEGPQREGHEPAGIPAFLWLILCPFGGFLAGAALGLAYFANRHNSGGWESLAIFGDCAVGSLFGFLLGLSLGVVLCWWKSPPEYRPKRPGPTPSDRVGSWRDSLRAWLGW
jgi:hypothetical protein